MTTIITGNETKITTEKSLDGYHYSRVRIILTQIFTEFRSIRAYALMEKIEDDKKH